MEIVFLSLYTGSLFLIVSTVAPVLLKTETDKNLAGHFYGKILWRFYRIAFLLLVLYLILSVKWTSVLLIAGLLVSMIISAKTRDYKRTIGNIEKYSYNDPIRVKFRRFSYLSITSLLTNLLIATIILLKEVR